MGVGSFYNHTNFCSATKPSSTLPKLIHYSQRWLAGWLYPRPGRGGRFHEANFSLGLVEIRFDGAVFIAYFVWTMPTLVAEQHKLFAKDQFV